MKVLLLRPNSIMKVWPAPIGLGYLAEALRTSRGDEVKILDARRWRLSDKRLAAEVRRFNPDVIGISALTLDSPDASRSAAVVKSVLPGVPVILGGPHASACGKAVLDDPSLDYAVIGEGEETLVDLMNALDGGGALDAIPGLAFKTPDGPVYNGPRDMIQDVDALNPAWDLIGPENYFSRLGKHTQNRFIKHRKSLSVFTSRGCPYHCIFCHNVFGKQFRARSPEAVTAEIAMLKDRYGVREIEILDDCFNLSKTRAAAICESILDNRLNLDFSLPNGVRGDVMDEELWDLFKEVGVFRVSFAPEVASPRMQKLVRKNADLDKMRQSIAMAADRGIVSMGFFMMGFPTETYEEMLMTADYAARSRLHFALFMYLNPFPGTEVARMAGTDAMDIRFKDYFHMPVNLSAATDEELHKANKFAYRKFYMNPRRLASAFKVMPKNQHTAMHLLPGFRLLFEDSVTF
ncbi:Radical SAM domain protein [Desulfatibacillum aliphaticivorans]|uniref:Radical SAM domain protein n=1 Tax=Desulfatibacillum aliphaticivorans TaxID=218208 RepID=B8FDJ8_DESAL|nr:radical SAM protein [Desulfatibacillum aliphaticivorans]ACL06629.1 Radical SAM domain protein [Desulfatibacillum aliphaticivorans]